MKTSALTDAALDWAVCVAKGCTYTIDVWLYEYKHLEGPRYSTDWSRGGPIIEWEGIELRGKAPNCHASYPTYSTFHGPTPLIAAMRCYVASKLGDEIEIPQELTC